MNLPTLLKNPFTKKEIQEVAIRIVDEITEGGKYILDVVEKVAATEELIKQVKANSLFKSAALDEIALLNFQEYLLKSEAYIIVDLMRSGAANKMDFASLFI